MHKGGKGGEEEEKEKGKKEAWRRGSGEEGEGEGWAKSSQNGGFGGSNRGGAVNPEPRDLPFNKRVQPRGSKCPRGE